MSFLRKYFCFNSDVMHDSEQEHNQSTDTILQVLDSSIITDHIASTASSLFAVGGFSTIHLSSLPGSPSTAAVFKLHEPTQRLYRMFHRELSILRQLRHPNIVKLLGYSDDEDSSLGTLVLEYVPNGTLHDNLHSMKRDDDHVSLLSPLSWSERVAVAFQLARALDYVHCMQIVHGDVKASNVLLDGDNNPKLCDFGFSRMGFLTSVERGNAATTMTMMMGSPGYVDPCYLRTGLVSKKNDVYSFGVVVLELITGLESFCCESGRALTKAVEEEGVVVVDERLKGEWDAGEVAVMAEIARGCVVENASFRPTMAEIVRTMEEKVKIAAGEKKN